MPGLLRRVLSGGRAGRVRQAGAAGAADRVPAESVRPARSARSAGSAGAAWALESAPRRLGRLARAGGRAQLPGRARLAAGVARVPGGRGLRVGPVLAVLAGLVVTARIGSGDPQAGTQFTLSSIAAVVVGGTSVFGGRGTLAGTLFGATLLVMLQNALNQLHVTAYYQYIWTGALLLSAVALYSIDEYRERG